MSESINDLMPNTDDINKERLEKLKELFPDLFTVEGKLNPDELKKIIDPDFNISERYDFKWYGKSEAKRKAFSPTTGTLIYDESRSVNPEKSNGNMIIEGENLEVLKLLRKAYYEKIKCIYIDPPYNTGNDFIYPDNYTQDKKEYWEENGFYKDGIKLTTNTRDDGRYHSNWLSMMYSRLLLARDLLKEDGVIFVSIDDHEVHNLRKIMDEVFGEDNFEANIIPIVNPGGRDYKQIAVTNEYILAYSKSDLSELNELPKEESFQFEDSQGGYNLRELRNRNPKFHSGNRPNLFYSFFVNPNSRVGNYCSVNIEKDDEHNIEVKPYNSEGKESVWRWGKPKASENITKNNIDLTQIVAKQKSDGNWNIYEKNRKNTTKAKSVWTETEMRTEDGTRTFREIFSESYFDHPKSVDLIKKCIQIGSNEEDIILDFFVGSGTLAQAVMELNRDFETNRKYIAVQVPEMIEHNTKAFEVGFKKISDITIERCKKLILDYGDNPTPINTGFKVYNLSKSNFKRIEFAPDPEKNEQENIELLKKYIKEKEENLHSFADKPELFDEVLLKSGFMLDYKKEQQTQFTENKVYLVTAEDHETLICLDEFINDKTIEYFKTNKDKKFICLGRALDTTKKYNLNHYLQSKLKTF